MKKKPIEYESHITRHFILYSKGHYKKTGDILADLRTMMSNASGTPESFYTKEVIYTFVAESFVDSCTKSNIKDLLKCFYHKPWGLGTRRATLKEMVSHMIGMMACIQVYEDIDGKKTELVKLGEPNPEYLPVPGPNEKSQLSP